MIAGALALFLSLAQTPPPASATLAFAVDGVKSARGQVVIAVYTSRAAWLDLARAAKVLRLPAREGSVFAVLEGLPVGACAVSVFHDENGNGKLDMGWLPFPGPTEGSAASNGATSRFGTPTWEDARIDCPAGETVLRLKLAS